MIIFNFIIILAFFLEKNFLYASEIGLIALGEVSKDDLVFRLPAPTDLRDCVQKLKNFEESLTKQLIPTLEDDVFVRNLSFGGFVLCREEKEPRLLPFTDSDKIIAFESGQKSCFLEAQSKVIRKAVMRPSLQGQHPEFEEFCFGKYMQSKDVEAKNSEERKMSRLEKQDVILETVCSHCNCFWNLDQLDEDEKEYYQSSSSYASGIRVFRKFTDEKAEIKGIASKLFDTLDDFGEKGMVHKDALKLNDHLEKIKRLLKKACDTADESIPRWCSEQKILYHLHVNEKFWKAVLRDKHTKKPLLACFLLIHTYQDPCPACRVTFIRAMKKLFQPFFEKELGIPFHMLITSREKYLVFPANRTQENIMGEEADSKALELVNSWDFDQGLQYSISLRRVSTLSS